MRSVDNSESMTVVVIANMLYHIYMFAGQIPPGARAVPLLFSHPLNYPAHITNHHVYRHISSNNKEDLNQWRSFIFNLVYVLRLRGADTSFVSWACGCQQSRLYRAILSNAIST